LLVQELHAARCTWKTFHFTAAVSGLSRLTLLDISHDSCAGSSFFNSLNLHGSISTIAKLTALQHLNVQNAPIHVENAANPEDSTAAICVQLANLTQLTFLSVGSVRWMMVIPAEDAAQLSALTGLRQLQLHGAHLGPGTDKLDWLGALTRLTQLR
jgi:hypothetical protein